MMRQPFIETGDLRHDGQHREDGEVGEQEQEDTLHGGSLCECLGLDPVRPAQVKGTLPKARSR